MTEFHPIQLSDVTQRGANYMPTEVTLRAYEVYKHLYGEQPALVTGDCRGGFGVGELVAFLYARSFPQEQWRARFKEAVQSPRR